MPVAVQGGYLSNATYCVQEFRLVQTVTGTRNVREPGSHARGRYHGRPFGPSTAVRRYWRSRVWENCGGAAQAECTEREMDVLIASPTGMLEANCRRGRCCVSATIHRAILSEDMNGSLSFLSQFQVWVIRELGMVRKRACVLGSGSCGLPVGGRPCSSQREIFSSCHRRYRIAEMRTFAEASSSMHKLCSKCKDNIDVWTLLSHLSREEVRLSKPSGESF